MSRVQWFEMTVLGMWVFAPFAAAETVRVCFDQEGAPVCVERAVPEGMSAVTAAIEALVAGPTATEAASGLVSAIPADARVSDLSVEDGTVTVDFSREILADFREERLQTLFWQFKSTLGDFEDIRDVRLTCENRPLCSFLAPVVSYGEPAPPVQALKVTGLAGRNITIGPSHGRYWNGSAWYYARPQTCGLGEEIQEDLNSIRLMQFLYQYLAQDGATVHVPRQLDQSDCCHPAEGLAWWRMAARYWLEHIGVPSWVWTAGTSDYGDDIYSRPLYADYQGSDIYISHHTNAGGGGTASGTEVYRDTEMSHPEHEAASYTLALSLKTNIESAIRDVYDAAWPIRNGGLPRDAAGAFGEIRIPDRPACLVELAFHDNCTKDALYLVDNFFRSTSQWGLYKGVCEYFGTTPTWDRYSYEIVGDTIPTFINAGDTYTVSVTLRNRGVLWREANLFRLGAVDDSDPFAAFNRVQISGEVRPGEEYTFSFTMTAPLTPGIYVTDWRMVRDGVTWFGPIVSKQVDVGNPPVVILADDFESYVDQASFESVWTDTGSSEYQHDSGFGNPGKSVRMPSPSASQLGRFFRNLGATYQGTDAEPLVFQYDLYLDSTGEPGWSGARHYCEVRGYSGGSYGSGTLLNLAALGLYNTSFDPFDTTSYQGRVYNNELSTTQWYTLDTEASAPVRTSGWHQLTTRMTGSEVSFYIDGILAERVNRYCPDGFNTVVLGSDLTANGHQVYVDNLQVLAYVAPPVIVLHPSPQNICPGSSATFTIEATGLGLSYQWQKNGVDLSNGGNVAGVDAPVLQIDAAGENDSGSYRCVVSNEGGQQPSNEAALTLRQLTTVLDQPASVEVDYGTTATFAISASGDGLVAYQWQKDTVDLVNGEEISGAQAPILQVFNAGLDDVGLYRCVATAGCGTAVSEEAALTLASPPGDFDGDADVDQADFGFFQACLTGSSNPQNEPSCQKAKLDGDTDVDIDDFGLFQRCFSGPNLPADPTCLD